MGKNKNKKANKAPVQNENGNQNKNQDTLMDIDTKQNSVTDIAVPNAPLSIGETDPSKQDQPVEITDSVTPIQKVAEKIVESQRSDEAFLESQAPYKDQEPVKIEKPIEYKQASEDSVERNEGIEKLVGHVTFDDQTFGNDSLDNKKGGVSFDASVDKEQKKKLKQPLSYTRYKTMTYREMKERERLRQNQFLGPGTYKGNDLNFGKSAKNGLIQPVPPKKVPIVRDNNPGPGAYNHQKADGIVKAKAPSASLNQTEMRRSKTVKEITPAPGAYDRHIKPFASDLNSSVQLGPTDPNKTLDRSEWLQSGLSNRENTPGPGFYKGNDVDFGKSSQNTLISRSGMQGRNVSPSINSSRRESMRAKLVTQGQPRYMSPTKSSSNKISGFSYGNMSDITNELKRIHQSNLTVQQQLQELERLERIHQKRVKFLQKKSEMIEMQKSTMEEDPSFDEYMSSKKFTGSTNISPVKQYGQRNNYMLNTRSSANKSLMNSTMNSIPEKRYLNKTMEFQPSLYGYGTGRNYSTLKPKLQGRKNSPGGKYQSPYAQPQRKKKKRVRQPQLEKSDSLARSAAELMQSMV